MNKELVDDETMARIQAEVNAFVFQKIDNLSLLVSPIEMLKDIFAIYKNEDLVMAAFHLGGILSVIYFWKENGKGTGTRKEVKNEKKKKEI